MASGYGQDDAKGMWVANRDFDFRNLKVQKGEKLPPAWQITENRNYLKKHYGEDCILLRVPAELVAGRAKAASPRKAVAKVR